MHAAAAGEPGTGDLVMFGGVGDAGTVPSDTWRWDGRMWLPLAPADTAGDGNPGPRLAHAMVHDEVRGVSLMAGGWLGDLGGACGAAPTWSLNETWAWSGQEWDRLADLPSEPGAHAMAFDGLSPLLVGRVPRRPVAP
jgi:hypothetical protein